MLSEEQLKRLEIMIRKKLFGSVSMEAHDQQAVADLLAEHKQLVEECKELRIQLAELDATFDLRHKADMRAIEMWRAAVPGRELQQPDHADMVTFLLEQLDAATIRALKLRESLNKFAELLEERP